LLSLATWMEVCLQGLKEHRCALFEALRRNRNQVQCSL
jgi:hypothetical protein